MRHRSIPALLAAALPSLALAQNVTWGQYVPATNAGVRVQHATAYDSASQRIVMFGGTIAALTEASDTWLWDGTDWTAAAPATVPPARARHALAFDASRQTVVMFGGFSN